MPVQRGPLRTSSLESRQLQRDVDWLLANLCLQCLLILHLLNWNATLNPKDLPVGSRTRLNFTLSLRHRRPLQSICAATDCTSRAYQSPDCALNSVKCCCCLNNLTLSRVFSSLIFLIIRYYYLVAYLKCVLDLRARE